MDQAPMCRCGNAMTSETSTITTVDGGTVFNGAPRSGTITIKYGSIFQCKPCIEKSDKEWMETTGKEMQQESIESVILKLFENLNENGFIKLVSYYKNANISEKRFIIETLDSKIASGENTTFLIMLKTRLDKMIDNDFRAELSKTCKIFLTADFEYKNIWFRDKIQTTGCETYKKYEIGFVFHGSQEAILHFRVLNNVASVNLTIKQNNYGDLYFDNTQNIDTHV